MITRNNDKPKELVREMPELHLSLVQHVTRTPVPAITASLSEHPTVASRVVVTTAPAASVTVFYKS